MRSAEKRCVTWLLTARPEMKQHRSRNIEGDSKYSYSSFNIHNLFRSLRAAFRTNLTPAPTLSTSLMSLWLSTRPMLTAPQETFPGPPEPEPERRQVKCKVWLRTELRQRPGRPPSRYCADPPGLDCVSQCQGAIQPSPAESWIQLWRQRIQGNRKCLSFIRALQLSDETI